MWGGGRGGGRGARTGMGGHFCELLFVVLEDKAFSNWNVV